MRRAPMPWAKAAAAASRRPQNANPATHPGRPAAAVRARACTWALAASALLAGCGQLTPPAGTPQPPLRSDFRPGGDTPADAVAEPTMARAAHEWDGFFADPRLHQVVGLALAQSRTLRAGAEGLARVRALAQVADSALLPEVRAGLAHSAQRSQGNTGRNTTLSVGVSAWEIDFFDRLGALQGAALARYLAQEDTQRALRLALVADTANAWLQLAAAQQRQRLAEALRDSQQRSLALTERQHALGGASGLQRARAQTAYESARADAAAQATAVTQARLQLELLVGQPVPRAWLPDGAMPPPLQAAPGAPAANAGMAAATAPATTPATVVPDLPAGLPATVLLQRPDLRAAAQTLQAAAYDVGAARAARFPRITLTASAGRRSTELDGLVREGASYWSLLPQIDLPLFDAGLRQAQVQANEAAQRAALASYEAALQAAFREVADALAVRDQLAERLAAQQAQVAAAQRAADASERGYRLGGLSQLELLDAQRTLAAAQQALVSLVFTEQSNRVLLMKALGGRWTGEPPNRAGG